MLGLLAFVCYVIRMSWQRPAMTMILALLFWVSNHCLEFHAVVFLYTDEEIQT